MSTSFLPRVAFVDAPSLAAPTRLALHGGIARVTRADFSLGVPSLSGAPGQAGVEWSYRDLKIRVRLRGSRADATGMLQKIALELLRPDNWLLVQFGPEDIPVWYRTYRTQPGELDLSNDVGQVDGDKTVGQWVISVPLSADPFAYGERVTLDPVTIHNDPASGSNPCSYLLPEILGDAPAPLRIDGVPSVARDQCDMLWSVAPVPDSWAGPIVWQLGTGDGFTPGADTSVPPDVTNRSGGSTRSVTFATVPTMATRVSGAVPAPVPPGLYMVFLRACRSDASSTFAVQFGYGGATVDVAGSPIVIMNRGASPAAGHTTWMPLGTFAFPKFYNELDIPGSAATPAIALKAARLTGAGNLEPDAILLVPVSLKGVGETARTLVSRFPSFGPQANDEACYWDGDLDVYTRVDAFGVIDTSLQPSEFNGDFPQVYPGHKNVLHHLQQTRLGSGVNPGADNSDILTATTTLTLSYQPRYLNLRGD